MALCYKYVNWFAEDVTMKSIVDLSTMTQINTLWNTSSLNWKNTESLGEEMN